MTCRPPATHAATWQQETTLDRVLTWAWGVGGLTALLLLGNLWQQEIPATHAGGAAHQPDAAPQAQPPHNPGVGSGGWAGRPT